MRLTELDPEWVCDAQPRSYRRTDRFEEAQGILFACPFCFQKNNGLVGTHMVLIWFADKNVPSECQPVARWQATGTSFEDLTIHPSINLAINREEWHGWIRNGDVT